MTIIGRIIVALLLAAFVAGGAGADEATVALAGGFALVDGDGRIVRSTDFPGRWLLVYFGYTHCSDQCPTALSALAEALDELGPAARHVQPIFVTVDPARDQGAILRTFTAAFDRRILGLGGDERAIAALAHALGVKYEKVLLGGDKDYVIDHSTTLSLIEPAGRSAITFDMAEPYKIAARIFAALEAAGLKLDDVNNLRAFR